MLRLAKSERWAWEMCWLAFIVMMRRTMMMWPREVRRNIWKSYEFSWNWVTCGRNEKMFSCFFLRQRRRQNFTRKFLSTTQNYHHRRVVLVMVNHQTNIVIQNSSWNVILVSWTLSLFTTIFLVVMSITLDDTGIYLHNFFFFWRQ